MNISAANDADPGNRNTPGKPRSPVDYFLHASFYNDSSLLFRARVLILSLYALVICSGLSLLFMLLAPVPAITRQIGVPVCAVFIAVSMPLLFKLRRDGNYGFCSRATVWVIFLPTALGIFITGGMTTSPVAHILMGPPLIMAFFFGGIRFGSWVAVIVGLLVASGLLLERSGISAMQVFTAEQLRVANPAFVMEGLFANTILAFLYETISGAVRRARDEEYQRVVQLAQTDALTGLVNRRVFDDALSKRIAQCHNGELKRSFALCYLDLNGFKPINDRHGHDVGDQVLRAVSIRLRSSLRGADLIGRQGGDEFMLLLGDLEPGPPLEILASRFLQLIESPIETSAGLLSVSGSLGFAFFSQHGSNTEALKSAADAAMYDAKRGRHGWCVYDPARMSPAVH